MACPIVLGDAAFGLTGNAFERAQSFGATAFSTAVNAVNTLSAYTIDPVTLNASFNFTVTEPVGIVGILAPEEAPLLALMTLILPVITAGNSVVALASRKAPYPAILLGEMLATSDLPGGVVNLLTGDRKETLSTFATHEHIRSLVAVADGGEATALQRGGAESVKRVKLHAPKTDWFSDKHDSPYAIRDFTEAKTVWHPMGS